MTETKVEEPTNGRELSQVTVQETKKDSSSTEIQSEPINQGPTLMDVLANPEAVKALTEIGRVWIESFSKYSKQQSRYSALRIVAVLGILGIITIAAIMLTYLDKMDSGSLTFLLGMEVGSLITFLCKTEIKMV